MGAEEIGGQMLWQTNWNSNLNFEEVKKKQSPWEGEKE